MPAGFVFYYVCLDKSVVQQNFITFDLIIYVVFLDATSSFLYKTTVLCSNFSAFFCWRFIYLFLKIGIKSQKG